MAAILARPAFAHSGATQVEAQFVQVVDQLERQLAAVAELLTDAETVLLTFATFPVNHWCHIWSKNIQERLNRELRLLTQAWWRFSSRRQGPL